MDLRVCQFESVYSSCVTAEKYNISNIHRPGVKISTKSPTSKYYLATAPLPIGLPCVSMMYIIYFKVIISCGLGANNSSNADMEVSVHPGLRLDQRREPINADYTQLVYFQCHCKDNQPRER
jgi:hypothetical protein